MMTHNNILQIGSWKCTEVSIYTICIRKVWLYQKYDYLVGLATASAIVEHEVPGSIPGSGEVLENSPKQPQVCEMVIENIMRKPTYQRDVLKDM